MEDNPWNVENFDEFLFYICPECNYFSKELEVLVDHAEDLHGENYSKVKLHSKIEVSETKFVSDNSSPVKQSVIDPISGFSTNEDTKAEVSLIDETEPRHETEPENKENMKKHDLQMPLKKASKRKQNFEKKRSEDEELARQCEYCESPLYYSRQDILKHLNENHDIVVVVTDRAKKQPKINSKALKQNEEFGTKTCAMSTSVVKIEHEGDSIIAHDDPIEPIEQDPLAISSFQCEFCSKKCKTEKGLQKHLEACSILMEKKFETFDKKVETCDNKLETCDLCLTKVSSIKYPEHRYTCELTLKLNNRKDFLTRHIEGFSKTHCCNDCGEKFSEKAALAHHISLHHEKERIICQVCQKRCDNADRLERHIQRMHINPRKKVKSKRVKCGFCKTEMSSTSLRRHIKNQHPGRK